MSGDYFVCFSLWFFMAHKVLFYVLQPAFIFKIGQRCKTSYKLAKKKACLNQKESRKKTSQLYCTLINLLDSLGFLP